MEHAMLRHQTRSWFFFAQAIAIIALASVSGCNLVKPPQDRKLRFDPALMRSPPEVAEASIQVLVTPNPEGNARLRVRFKEKLAQQGPVIQGGAGPTRLRDDGVGADERAGDGTFSAFVNFDAAGYEAELARRAARKVKEVPVFKNRVLAAKKRPENRRAWRFPPGDTIPIFPFEPDPSAVDPPRELMITDVGVVEDPARTYNPCTGAGTPMGAWTFGKLMTEMANEPATGINPSDFTLHWLQQWNMNLVINNFTVANRSVGLNDLILNPWPKLADGRLDLAQAPFRLLAIVNRIDLRGSTAYGSGDAGEARLVFGLLRCSPPPPWTEVQQFTVIFEYGIRKSSCPAVRDWAQQWHALGTIVLASAPYNAALQAITDQFTLRDADWSKPPNRNALNQLRTNEFALMGPAADAFWQLREFRICGDAGVCGFGQLEEVTVAQTPDVSFQGFSNKRSLLDGFVNANESAILAGTNIIPLQLPPSTPFRAGDIQPSGPFTWDPGGITNSEARHDFALATCNGCHTRETGTKFLHISPRNAGSPAALSDFLTGLNQPKTDPVSGVSRTFHDLLDRQGKLDAAANMICLPRVFPVEDFFPLFLPRAFVH
jgi:hypothetical protein